MNGNDDEQIREIICDYQSAFASVFWQLTEEFKMYILAYAASAIILLCACIAMLPVIALSIANIIMAIIWGI